MAARLDATDWKILRELMADGRITNVTLAQRAGITPPPCLRRLRALEEAGYVRGYHARVDEAMLGYSIGVFVMVTLHNHAQSDLRAFEDAVLRWPVVRECYMMSGDSDYLLRCVAQDMPSFQEFLLGQLTPTPNVASVKTQVTIRKTKDEPGVPVVSP
ncbi:MAG: Lrp/AsnC family transcriptional regulator [Hyphomicrobiaceae bacterium]|nr:Lrp/AsnC family transcriptional regulator [Hyphomicrobiaceae bacterium]